MIEFEPLDGPFGRAVHGLDVSTGVDADTCRALHEALYEHRVLVVKNQICDADAFLAFGRQWGTPIPHVIYTSRMPGYPDMIEVGNTSERARDELARNSAAFWHTDQSYDANPATVTMLYAHKIPDVGGETRIIDMKAAYDDLDDTTKQRIDKLTAMHLYGATSGRGGEAPTAGLNETQAAAPPSSDPHGKSGKGAVRCRRYSIWDRWYGGRGRRSVDRRIESPLRTGQVYLRAQIRGGRHRHVGYPDDFAFCQTDWSTRWQGARPSIMAD